MEVSSNIVFSFFHVPLHNSSECHRWQLYAVHAKVRLRHLDLSLPVGGSPAWPEGGRILT